MRHRWAILAVLFVVRLTMAFQFQSVAAVAPLLGRQYGVGLADIGILIGLYFTPGIALALPGGAIGQKFGDKTTVLVAIDGRSEDDNVGSSRVFPLTTSRFAPATYWRGMLPTKTKDIAIRMTKTTATSSR